MSLGIDAALSALDGLTAWAIVALAKSTTLPRTDAMMARTAVSEAQASEARQKSTRDRRKL